MITATATSTKIPSGASFALPFVCTSSSGESAEAPWPSAARRDVVRLRLGNGERRRAGRIVVASRLDRRKRAQHGEVGGDRPDEPWPPTRRPQLEHGDADEQLAVDGEVRRADDLVAVDEGAVAGVEVLDPDAVGLGRDQHVAARQELVLLQGDARAGVAAELDRAGQRDHPARFGAFDDLQNVVRHRSSLLDVVCRDRMASIGEEVGMAKSGLPRR